MLGAAELWVLWRLNRPHLPRYLSDGVKQLPRLQPLLGLQAAAPTWRAVQLGLGSFWVIWASEGCWEWENTTGRLVL